MKIYPILFFILNSVILFSQPVAYFEADKTTGCGKTAIHFDASASNGYIYFQWNFGNGQTNNNELKPMVFYNPGSYVVKLTVYGEGTVDSMSLSLVIRKPPEGHIVFTSKNYGCVGDTISFRTLITEGDAPITSINWIYGDGEKGIGNSSSHSYLYPNPEIGYPLVLELNDTNNCSFKTYQYIRISDQPQLNIIPSTFYSCDTGAISFAGDVYSSASIKEYFWDFGNGNTSNQVNTSTNYNASGKYKVSFYVSDINSCSNEIDTSIYVYKINANILNPDTACLGDTIIFNASENEAISYLWIFNGSDSITQESPQMYLNDSGSVDVLLNISNPYCESTDSAHIHIIPFIADFYMDTSWVCTFPLSVSFINSTLGNSNEWLWDFGDGETSQEQNPVHEFNDTGLIKLAATSKFGCISYKEKLLDLKRPKPVINVSVSEGCIPQNVDFNPDSSIAVSQINGYRWTVSNGSWISGERYSSFTYDEPIIDTIKLTVYDELCGFETASKIIKFGRKPNASIIVDDTLCIQKNNFFKNDSYPLDTIDFHKWTVDGHIYYSTSLWYSYFLDFAYYNPIIGDFVYDKNYPLPTDSSTIELVEGYYGCYDTVCSTVKLQGPVVDITEDFITSCDIPDEHNFVVKLYQVNKLIFEYISLKNGSDYKDSIVFANDTSLSDTITTTLVPGFYNLKISAFNYNSKCDLSFYYNKWDCRGITCQNKNAVIAISDVVSSDFTMEETTVCSDQIVHLDYSSSDNAYLFVWYKNDGWGE